MIFDLDHRTPQQLELEMRDLARRLKLENIAQAMRFPRFVLVETVHACNSRCPFCTVDKWKTDTPFMPDALFDKIADELIRHADWIFYVYLQKAGEPLLDKKIAPRIRRLKAGGIKRINLSTNASLLTETKAVELMEAGLDEIMLSIDSLEKEEYESLRPGLKFETVMDNIHTVFKMRDRIKPDMLIRIRGILFKDLETPEGKAFIENWERFWNGLKKEQDRIYMKRPHSWGNQHSWQDNIPQYDLCYHPCILPWSTFNINSDGSVPLCGQDYEAKHCMGNVNDNTIQEIWTGEPFQEVRRLHSQGNRNELSFCRGCRLFDEEFSLEKDRPALPV